MEHFIQKFHSGWAYLALLLLIIAVANAFIGFQSKKTFTAKDRKIALFALIACHIQLLVGLILYFLSSVGFALLGNWETTARLTAVEHPLINIIAIVAITVGWSKHKKQVADLSKFKSIMSFYAIGLILVLSRIPWHLWF